MTYSYFNYIKEEGLISTNLKAISKASGIEYQSLRRMLSNGTYFINTQEFLLFKGDLRKGRQRIVKTGDVTKDNINDFFDNVK